CAAMPETLDQIRTSVPCFALRTIRLKGTLAQEEKLPAGECDAQVVRKTQRVFRSFCGHDISRHQKRVKRLVVVLGNKREVIVRKGGVEVLPRAVDAFAHRALECCF